MPGGFKIGIDPVTGKGKTPPSGGLLNTFTDFWNCTDTCDSSGSHQAQCPNEVLEECSPGLLGLCYMKIQKYYCQDFLSNPIISHTGCCVKSGNAGWYPCGVYNESTSKCTTSNNFIGLIDNIP